MAKPPLSAAERVKVGTFLGGLLRGTQELGFSALPMVDLYGRAKAEGISLVDLALEDQATADMLARALSSKLRRLSPNTLRTFQASVAMALDGRGGRPELDSDDPG